MLTLPLGRNNRSPVPGQGKVLRSNEPLRDGLVKELVLIQLKEGAIGLFLNAQRGVFKFRQKLFDRDLLYRSRLGFLNYWLFGLVFCRMDMWGEIVGNRVP